MTAQRRPRTHHGISTGNAHLARLPNTYSCFQCVCSRRFESICGLIVMVNRTSIPDCTVQGHSGDDHDGGDCWCSLNLVQIWSKFGPNLVQIGSKFGPAAGSMLALTANRRVVQAARRAPQARGPGNHPASCVLAPIKPLTSTCTGSLPPRLPRWPLRLPRTPT